MPPSKLIYILLEEDKKKYLSSFEDKKRIDKGKKDRSDPDYAFNLQYGEDFEKLLPEIQKEIKARIYKILMDSPDFWKSSGENVIKGLEKIKLDWKESSLEVLIDNEKILDIPKEEYNSKFLQFYEKADRDRFSGKNHDANTVYVIQYTLSNKKRKDKPHKFTSYRKLSKESYRKIAEYKKNVINPSDKNEHEVDVYYASMPTKKYGERRGKELFKYVFSATSNQYSSFSEEFKEETQMILVPIEDIEKRDTDALFVPYEEVKNYETYKSKESKKISQQKGQVKNYNVGKLFNSTVSAFLEFSKEYSIKTLNAFNKTVKELANEINKNKEVNLSLYDILLKDLPTKTGNTLDYFVNLAIEDKDNSYDKSIQSLVDKVQDAKKSKKQPKKEPKKEPKKDTEPQKTPEKDQNKSSNDYDNFLKGKETIFSEMESSLKKVYNRSSSSEEKSSSNKELTEKIDSFINSLVKSYSKYQDAVEVIKLLKSKNYVSGDLYQRIVGDFSNYFSNIKEMSATGTGASAEPGSGEGMTAKYAFGGAGGTKAKRKKGIMITKTLKESYNLLDTYKRLFKKDLP